MVLICRNGGLMLVGVFAIAVSLMGAWQAARDPAPALSESQREALYLSNLRNFAESCEGRAGDARNAGLLEFCRRQAQLLRSLAPGDSECARRTAAFVASDPSK